MLQAKGLNLCTCTCTLSHRQVDGCNGTIPVWQEYCKSARQSQEKLLEDCVLSPQQSKDVMAGVVRLVRA